MQAFITLFSSLILMATDVGNSKNHVAETMSQMTGVTTLSFSKEMVDAINLDVELEDRIKHLAGDFEEVRLYIINNESTNITEKKKEILQTLNTNYTEEKLEEAEINTSSDFKFFLKRKGNTIEEAHLYINSPDSSLMILSFIGNVQVEDK